MKEAIFILFVTFVLLGLTAIRYRKQIAGIIGVARMLQDAKNTQAIGRKAEPTSKQLVNCTKCGVWVPERKSVKGRDGSVACLNCS
jgi:hypothetical protein